MLIKVKVFPESDRDEIIKKSEDTFYAWVREKAEGNLANRALISLLSSYFRIPPSRVRLLKGARQRNKIFELRLD